jgi:hypothetical protein
VLGPAAVQRQGRPIDGFAGHWLARDGLILTAITVPPLATH